MSADVRDAIAQAIWDGLCNQVDMGYVDPDRGIIDTGMADDLDMRKVADAVLAALGLSQEWRAKGFLPNDERTARRAAASMGGGELQSRWVGKWTTEAGPIAEQEPK